MKWTRLANTPAPPIGLGLRLGFAGATGSRPSDSKRDTPRGVKRIRSIPLALLALGLAAAAPRPRAAAEDAARFEVYSLAGAEIEPAVELVSALAGPEGQVTPDPAHQRLLVVTTSERHAQIAEAMRKMAVPARNVLIEVRMSSAGESRRSERSAAGSGEWSAGPGGFGGVIRIEPRIEDRQTSRTGETTQTLLVGSGREGFLRVGEQVPHLAWIMDFGRRGGWIATPWEWQEVGSFLVVQPTVIGDGPMIRVRVIPELRGRAGGRAERLRFTALATDIIARSGETIPLGGFGDGREFADRFLVGAASGGWTESLEIRLTPRIQP